MSFFKGVQQKISTLNSTTTIITAGNSFTGTAEEGYFYPSMIVTVKTDQQGTLFVDFSTNGTNWDSTLSFNVDANKPETQRVTISRRYFRIRFTNTSASNQTEFRLQTLLGDHTFLSTPMNAIVQRDAGSQLVKSFGEEFLISGGYFDGYSIITKFGRNLDIDTASVPEDMWNGGGIYAGFPVSTVEEFEIVLSSASDIGGVVTFQYLASPTSTSWQTATITTTGLNTFTGISGWRMHTAQFSSGTATTFNIGTVTVRHRTTIANIFFIMPIGRSQTNTCVYTIPFGYTGKIVRFFADMDVSTTATATGSIWVREYLKSPRLRRPFSISNTKGYIEKPYGGLIFLAQSDITVRIDSASANNLIISAGFDLVLIPNS